MATESKQHYKLYKAGRRWLCAAITVAGVGLAISAKPQAVSADSTDQTPSGQATAATTPATQPSVPLTSATIPPAPAASDATQPADASTPATSGDESATPNAGTATTESAPEAATPAPAKAPESATAAEATTAPTATLTLTSPTTSAAVSASADDDASNDTLTAETTVPVADMSATNLTLKLANPGSSATPVDEVLTLANGADTTWTVGRNVTEATFTDALPASDYTLAYATTAAPSEFKSYADLTQADPDFTFANLAAVKITGNVPANSTATLVIPVTFTGELPRLRTDTAGTGHFKLTSTVGTSNPTTLDLTAKMNIVAPKGKYVTINNATKDTTLNLDDGFKFYTNLGDGTTITDINYVPHETTLEDPDVVVVQLSDGTYHVAHEGQFKVKYAVVTQSGNNTYTETSEGIFIVTAKIDEATTTSTRTIHLVDEAGKDISDPEVQTMTYTTATNALSGVTSYTSQAAYPAFTAPTIAGYTPTTATVPAETAATSTTAPTNTDVTIQYKKATTVVNTASLIIVREIDFVDPDGKKLLAPIKQPVSYTSTTDTATGIITYTPAGNFQAVEPKDISGYTKDTSTIPAVTPVPTTTKPTKTTITVTYTPIVTTDKLTTTRTINFVDENGDSVADSITQPVEYTTSTNEATGVTTYTPSGDYPAATAPTVKGYATATTAIQAETLAETTTKPEDSTIEVTYSPVITTGTLTTTRTINFVDENGDPITDSITQPVEYATSTNEATGITTYTPSGDYPAATAPTVKGYAPATKEIPAATLTETTTKPADSTIQVTYSPIITTGTLTTTRTINFVDENGDSVADSITQPVDYATSTNEATGITTYTPSGDYPAATAPTVKGYATATTAIPAATLAETTTKPEDSTIKVTYSPVITTDTLTTTRTINFVDENGDKIADSITQPVDYATSTNEATGVTTYTPSGDYPAATAPTVKGYATATTAIPAATLAETTTKPEDSTFKVTYSPVITTGTLTTTRTINFVDENGDPIIDSITQPVDYDTSTNEATGITTYTPSGDYPAATAPTVKGYATANTAIPAATLAETTTKPANSTITVTYSPVITTDTLTTTRTINFVDENGDSVADSITQPVDYATSTNEATGITTYTPTGDYPAATVPTVKGYAPATEAIPAATLAETTTQPEDSTINVTYSPIITTDTLTTTRTINFVDENGNPIADSITQPVDYATSTNEATGVTTYTPNGDYPVTTVPTIDGYSTTTPEISAVALSTTTTLPSDSTVTVTYEKLPVAVAAVEPTQAQQPATKPTTLPVTHTAAKRRRLDSPRLSRHRNRPSRPARRCQQPVTTPPTPRR